MDQIVLNILWLLDNTIIWEVDEVPRKYFKTYSLGLLIYIYIYFFKIQNYIYEQRRFVARPILYIYATKFSNNNTHFPHILQYVYYIRLAFVVNVIIPICSNKRNIHQLARGHKHIFKIILFSIITKNEHNLDIKNYNNLIILKITNIVQHLCSDKMFRYRLYQNYKMKKLNNF